MAGVKRGFNPHRIEGDIVYMDFLDRQGNVKATGMIDAADLPLLIGLGMRWTCSNVTPRTRNAAPKTYVQAWPDGRAVYLHRLIVGCPTDKVVDHLNGNPLDNRRANIRVTDKAGNGRNRTGAQQNSTTGLRGVTYLKTAPSRRWVVQLQQGRSQIFRFRCHTRNIAAITASLARAQHWGVEAA